MNEWTGCYDQGWGDNLVPDAYSHPAKYSRGLIHRIYQHAKEEGWVKQGDYVVDPFGGVALGGLDAMSIGLNWVGVELEAKFVILGNQNIALWKRQLSGWPNLGTARIVQGDSRRIGEVVKGAGMILSSPPYCEGLGHGMTKTRDVDIKKGLVMLAQSTYGHTPGNLANMKEGDIAAVISSPPYEGSLHPNESREIEESRLKRRGLISTLAKSSRDGHFAGDHNRGYTESNNNLGNSSGSTFWSASLEIVQGCYSILRPGGHAIWVCKDYVKGGKRVPFSDRWQALCKSVGFTLVCRHQAMLVKSYGKQTCLNGDCEEITVERKSFFRRLAESKGSPRIDHEDVICLKK